MVTETRATSWPVLRSRASWTSFSKSQSFQISPRGLPVALAAVTNLASRRSRCKRNSSRARSVWIPLPRRRNGRQAINKAAAPSGIPPTSIHHMLRYHSLYMENSLLLFDQKNNGIAIPSPTSNQFFQFRQYAIENLGPVGKALLPE